MWPDSQFPADFATFTEEILFGKHFCAVTTGGVFTNFDNFYLNAYKTGLKSNKCTLFSFDATKKDVLRYSFMP